MRKLKIIVSVLILLSYLMPFQSCGHEVVTEQTAINDSNEASEAGDTLFDKNAYASEAFKLKIKTANSNDPSVIKTLITKIVYPGEDAISGLGLILFMETNIGGLFIMVSFLLSILTIIPFNFLKQPQPRIFFIGLNLLSMAAFVIHALIVKEAELLLGTWLMAGLLLTRLIIERRISRRISSTDESAEMN